MCVYVFACVCIYIYFVVPYMFSYLFKMLCTGIDPGINIMWVPSDTGKQLV